MRKNMKNQARISGLVYQHSLELKTAGPNSKNPGVQFINGTIEIATDNACLNIVPIHYTYVTATTKSGAANPTFNTLMNVINGVIGNIMEHGKDKAGRVRADTNVNLNEFYSNRSGSEELVSVKRNEGGFIHAMTEAELNDIEEKNRNTFECDMLITRVTHVDANEEAHTAEKAILGGVIFDFRNAILPVEFSVLNPNAIAYFEDADISQKNPMFTEVRGNQISETVVRTIEEESAFGEASIREVKNTRKDFVVNWARKEPYLWDDESTITAADLQRLQSEREVYLATMKSRSDEYRAQRGNAIPTPAIPSPDGFDF